MKPIKLIIASLLLLVGGNVFAQNGTTPFVGSTHTYEVTKGLATGSTLTWSVLNTADKLGADAADFTIASNGGATVDITWKKAGNYTVQLAEENSTTGCITLRQSDVVVGTNQFDIAIADLTATCSDASGTVIVNNANDNLGTTSKTFTIDMKTQADMTGATFIPDWKFDYEVTSTNGDLQTVTFDDNTAVTSPVVGANSATGTVTVNNDDYSIQLTVVFNNTWNNGDVITVTLSNGIELTYNTPDGLNTNDEGAITINALPATTNITTD